MEDFLFSLAYGLGYLGVFFIGFLSSVTIFLPTPAFAIVFALAAPQFGFNPLLLGLFAGTGAAFGELTGYILGYGGKAVLLKKYRKQLAKVEAGFKRYGAPAIIFVFAVTPLPFDIVGMFCGIVGYPWKKFFIATLAGKLVKYVAIAYAGFYGIQWISQMMGI